MARPPQYTRAYSFTDFETLNPGQPKPGDKLDTEYDNVSNALTATQNALALIQRDDGALANGIVGEDQLDPTLFEGIADEAVAEAEAAAAAAASSASAAAGSAASAASSDAAAVASAATASGAAAQAGVSQGIAQSAGSDAAALADDAADSATAAANSANEAQGFRNEAGLHEDMSFKWAELLTGPVLPAPPGWPEAVDDGMFSSKWWAIRARDYNATQTIDLGTAGADIGEAFDIWDAIPGNDLGIGQTYATWGTPTHTYVLIDRSNPSDPASWLDITGGPGPPGPPNTLTVGTVTTGSPGTPVVVTITGASPNQVLNMTIPRGDTGATGPAGPAGPPNALAIGTVTTVPDGTPSDATITGTAPTQTLNLTLTAGPPGIQGPIGPAGTPVLGNPSVLVGLTAVNGVGTAAMRADGAPALSQAIVPTWTGAHKFSNVVKLGEVADPGLAAADEYWLTAQDDSGITRLWSHNSRAAWVINQDNYVIGRNVSGSTIPKLRAVKAVGGSANRPTIGLADSSTGPAGGITAASAANNGFVEVMTLGVMTQVDTSAWAPSTRLYLGTAGVLTSTPPAFPATLQLLGVVLDQHAINGSIYISRSADTRAGITAGDAFANPTASVGLAAVNGSAITMMRSDAAPALSQAIAPTWTGQHTWSLPLRAPDGTAALPSLTFPADLTTGMYRFGAGIIGFTTTGAYRMSIAAGYVDFTGVPQIFAPNGSAGVPAYSFASDPNTGIYRRGADDLGISVGGVLAAVFSASQTTFPLAPVYIVDGTAGAPGLAFNGDTNTGFFRSASDLMQACAGGVSLLNFLGPLASSIPRVTVATIISLQDGSAAFPAISFENDLDTGMYRNAANSLVLTCGGAPVVVVVASGVDIGAPVSAPSYTTTSSRGLKRETGAPMSARGILARLRPIMYRLLAGGDSEQLGLIAEEVHEVCPQLSDGKSVAYDRLAILLLAAWQDEHMAEAA